MKKYNIAIVGATGLVGSTFIEVMQEYKIEVENLYLYASERSEGKVINYLGKEYVVQDLAKARFDNVDFALFSAGGSISAEYAPKFAAGGAVVIDNSSYFRMHDECPLIVPEINLNDYKEGKRIIANPNCSTIQSVLPLYYLDNEFKVKRIVYTTYQAVAGSGMKGINDLKRSREGKGYSFYPYDISKTCIPEIDAFLDNHYTKAEMKMVNETNKILHKNIPISATCIRVPVERSHGVVIQAEFEKEIDIEKAIKALDGKPGVKVVDNIANHGYPVSTIATGNDLVYVGRIRKDLSCKNGLIFYTVSDNVRKGAAANAVQIMVGIIKMENKLC